MISGSADPVQNIKENFRNELDTLHDSLRKSGSGPEWWGYRGTSIEESKYFKPIETEHLSRRKYKIKVLGPDVLLNLKVYGETLRFNIQEMSNFDFMIDSEKSIKELKRVFLMKINTKKLENLIVNKRLKEMYVSGLSMNSEGFYYKMNYPLKIECGRYIYELVKNNNFSRTLDVGLGEGLAALWLMQALKESKTKEPKLHVSIDPNQTSEYYRAGLYGIYVSKLDKYLHFIEKPSYKVLPNIYADMLNNNRPGFDVIFINGWHTFDYMLVDFFYSDKILKTGGYVIFRDKRLPSVRKLMEFIKSNFKNYEMNYESNFLMDIASFTKTKEAFRNWNFNIAF